MAAFLNSCYFTATLGGTTDWTPSAAVTGYMTPTGANAVTGKTYKFRAENAALTEWELCEGVWNGTTLARTTVLQNSLGTTAKINFTGPPNVGIITAKEDTLGIDEANSWTKTQKAQARANLDVLNKNYIINGAMMVSQENGTTAGTAVNYYPADQWLVTTNNGGVVSSAQVASVSPAGSPNRIRLTVTTADAAVAAGDYQMIRQKLEGLRVADLMYGTASAKAIIIQFGVKAPAGTYCVSVLNSANNRSYVAEYVISGGEANTDVVKSVTIPGDTSGTWLNTNGTGLEIRWGLMAGTTYQQAAGSWSTGNPVGSSNQFNFLGTISNVFELFDVGVYEGNAAPAFQVPDYPAELLACQRYFHINTMANKPGLFLTNGFTIFIPKPVPMRATPSITHNFTNASFTASGAPTSTQWGIQVPNVSALTKTGTLTLGTNAAAEGTDAIWGWGCTFSSAGTAAVCGSTIAPVKVSARL